YEISRKATVNNQLVETINNENQLNKIENLGYVDNRHFRTVFGLNKWNLLLSKAS
ncbi:hypothetical protein Anas_12415, partial [Armadillidium nasatum]